MPARRVPHPPPDLDRRKLPVDSISKPDTLYRIHRSVHGPLWFGPGAGNPAAYRFDAPGGEYGVCYFGVTPGASFAETFLRTPPVRLIAMEELAARSLAILRPRRSLRLVSLHGPGLARLGATAEVASGGYGLSREWSIALWRHPSAPDGILYRCRHDDESFAIALFDRAGDAVDHESSDPWLRRPALLAALARRYGFGLIP